MRHTRQPALMWLHTAVLLAFAVVQPIFEKIVSDQHFFIFSRNASAGEIIAVAVGLSLWAPMLLKLLDWGGRAIGGALHGVIMRAAFFCSASLAAWYFGFSAYAATWPVWLSAGGSCALGACVLLAYLRIGFLPQMLSLASWSMLIFPCWFLFVSPVRSLVLMPDGVSSVVATPDQSRPPIVFIIFDELPLATLLDESLQIDATRFPNLAALAETATWYPRATTVSDETTWAVPAILSGRYRQGGAMPNVLARDGGSVFTELAPYYHMDVAEHYTRMCPRALCAQEAMGSIGQKVGWYLRDLTAVYLYAALPPAWHRYVPNLDGNIRGEFQRAVSQRYRYAPQSVRRLQALQGGEFYFLHMPLPHHPFIFAPSGRSYVVPPLERQIFPGSMAGLVPGKDYVWSSNLAAVKQYQRHILQTMYVDWMIGHAMDALRESETFDDAMIVLTSDHGVHFGTDANGRFLEQTAGAHVGSIVPVPLLIKFPQQQRGERNDAPVELIDIVPTLLRAVDVQPTYAMDGLALQSIAADIRQVKRVLTEDGTFELLQEQLDEALHTQVVRKNDFFGGDRSGLAGVYAFGRYPELHGQEVAELRVQPARLVANLYPSRAQLRVPPQAAAWTIADGVPPLLPALVNAEVRGAVPGGSLPATFVVALDGKIVATPSAFSSGMDRHYVAAMVPESLLSAGEHELTLYQVVRTGDSFTLYPAQQIVRK